MDTVVPISTAWCLEPSTQTLESVQGLPIGLSFISLLETCFIYHTVLMNIENHYTAGPAVLTVEHTLVCVFQAIAFTTVTSMCSETSTYPRELRIQIYTMMAPSAPPS